MGMFQQLQASEDSIKAIDWEMTPDLTFGTFESWGGRERVRNNNELIYYFFIDNWGDSPELCLMERGVKHARVLAEVKAPYDMIAACVKDQGSSSLFEKSYAINPEIKKWLIDNVVDADDPESLVPLYDQEYHEDMGKKLPALGETPYTGEIITLPVEEKTFKEDELEGIIKKYNFFDRENNPQGNFTSSLVDPGDGLTVVDQRTSLMWQQGGLDISSVRTMIRNIEQLNKEGFAGYHNWRMPSLEEAMSLLEPQKNNKEIYLRRCFMKEQAFVFVAAKRKPGGYWFVDYKQGRAFWASGTIPGGFCRLCRTVSE